MGGNSTETSYLGARGELAVCSRALKFGFLVFKSITSVGVVDLVFYKNGRLKTVQVKTVGRDQISWYEVQKSKKKKLPACNLPDRYFEEIDWFIRWYEDTELFVLIDVSKMRDNIEVRYESDTSKYTRWW